MKKAFLILLLLSVVAIPFCTKSSFCPAKEEVQGEWKLKRVMKLAKPLSIYDSTFYYSYEFIDDKITVIQFRNGVDSFIRTKDFECKSVWYICPDSIYYGDVANYGVLVKKF